MTEYKIQVYKIWYEDEPDEFYIGSTKKKRLSQRMAGHRDAVKRGKTSTIYNLMRTKGVDDFKYVLIASCMVTCREEQLQFEQQWIDTLKPTLNSNRAYNSEGYNKEYNKDYYKNNKNYFKEYNELNKERRKQQCKKANQKFIGNKEYLQKRREKYDIQKNKEYYEKIKDIRTCICGKQYNYGRKSSRTEHYNSKRHTEYALKAQQLFTA
jgi:hypothetical protein